MFFQNSSELRTNLNLVHQWLSHATEPKHTQRWQVQTQFSQQEKISLLHARLLLLDYWHIVSFYLIMVTAFL